MGAGAKGALGRAEGGSSHLPSGALFVASPIRRYGNKGPSVATCITRAYVWYSLVEKCGVAYKLCGCRVPSESRLRDPFSSTRDKSEEETASFSRNRFTSFHFVDVARVPSRRGNKKYSPHFTIPSCRSVSLALTLTLFLFLFLSLFVFSRPLARTGNSHRENGKYRLWSAGVKVFRAKSERVPDNMLVSATIYCQ